jgi:hypothetical protein
LKLDASTRSGTTSRPGSIRAGSLRFKIAASAFLDRKIIQETRFRAW